MNSSQYCHLNQDLAQSVDLFLMRKFEHCFDLCNDIIVLAKNEPEQERNEEVIEAATAMGIQALAESDSWHRTFSFVNEVYGAIDFCPPRIIQVCILLHAHMREYMLCHKLIQMWLQNPSNLTHKMCSQVIRIYTQHVLCPTESVETLKQILDNCRSISNTMKSSLLEQVMSEIESNKNPASHHIERRISQTDFAPYCTELIDATEKNPLNPTTDVAEDDDNDRLGNFDENDTLYSPVQNVLMSIFESVCSFMKCNIKFLQNKYIQTVLMAVVAVLALVQSQTGDPFSSLGRVVIIWKAFLLRIGLISRK